LAIEKPALKVVYSR